MYVVSANYSINNIPTIQDFFLLNTKQQNIYYSFVYSIHDMVISGLRETVSNSFIIVLLAKTSKKCIGL